MNKPCITSVLIIALSATFSFGQAVSPTINDFPSRQFGHSVNAPAFNQPLNTSSPNLVEGRELNAPYAIAFDTSVTPPILYVADTFNNRILAFKNPDNLKPCGINVSNCGLADKVIGQRDFYTTLQGGPQRQGISSGFTYPTSVAVDANGNLYVLDSGNNRILRFPSPFKQTVSPPVTDLVIGQKTVNVGNLPNQGQGSVVDPTTLNFGAAAPVGMAIDPTKGDLWVSDYNNDRALRFPVSQLAAGTVLPQADLVLGQNSMTTTAVDQCSTQGGLARNCMLRPTGMTFDAKGNLYIADAYQRVMFFGNPPFVLGLGAARILGLAEGLPGANLTPTNKYGLLGPSGLFSDGSHLFVIDAGNNRVAEYDVPGNWPAGPPPGVIPQTIQDSPPIMAVFGQPDLVSGKSNRLQPEPDATTFSFPIVAGGGAFKGADMWVTDVGNNRVLGLPAQGASFGAANRLVGQVDFPYFQPNLIEGRELFLSVSPTGPGGAVAIDHSSNPPHLYIADAYNHRVLGFVDARKVKPGQRADIVIGQTDLGGQPGSRFYRALANSPRNDVQIQTQTGLNQPSGLVVDGSGNLWVADSGNGRVLRFPPPSFAADAPAPLPNLVLGQQSFTSQVTDATQQNTRFPYGLALFTNDRAIAVSDPFLHRILIFKRPAGGDYQSGANADIVLGQQNFSNSLFSSSNSGLNSPRHMGVDSSDRLYVADSNNNRMVVYSNPLGSANGTSSALQLAMSAPQGVVVSQSTGETFVTLGNATIWRLPEFNVLSLQSNPNAPPYTQQLSLQSIPYDIAFDNSGNIIVAESANRATFYYAKLTYQHAANYSGGNGTTGAYVTPVAPGQLTLLYRLGQDFNLPPATATTNPWPTVMSDLQITVNGTPAPIYRVDPTVIAFQVPSNAPQGGTADFLLTHPSNGEIVGAGSIPMAQYNPGFFTAGAAGFGQVAAFIDGTATVNNNANPVLRDGTHFISFCLTGGGVFDGGGGAPPADGFAPTVAAATHDVPQLISDSFPPNFIVPASAVTYSGAGCGFAGGWQVNFFPPQLIPPGVRTIGLQISGINSGTGPGGPNTVHLTYVTK